MRATRADARRMRNDQPSRRLRSLASTSTFSPLESMNATSERSSTTGWWRWRRRVSSAASRGAVAMSSSPWTMISRSPRRSATSVTFQRGGGPDMPGSGPYRVGPLSGCSGAAEHEPHAGGVVRLDAPAVGQAADEVEAEAARILELARARLRDEAVAVVDHLDAHLAVPAGADLERPLAVRVADRVRDELGDQQLQRLAVVRGQRRAHGIEDTRARLRD